MTHAHKSACHTRVPRDLQLTDHHIILKARHVSDLRPFGKVKIGFHEYFELMVQKYVNSLNYEPSCMVYEFHLKNSTKYHFDVYKKFNIEKDWR